MSTIKAKETKKLVSINAEIPRELNEWVRTYAQKTGRKYRGVLILALEAYRRMADHQAI